MKYFRQLLLAINSLANSYKIFNLMKLICYKLLHFRQYAANNLKIKDSEK